MRARETEKRRAERRVRFYSANNVFVYSARVLENNGIMVLVYVHQYLDSSRKPNQWSRGSAGNAGDLLVGTRSGQFRGRSATRRRHLTLRSEFSMSSSIITVCTRDTIRAHNRHYSARRSDRGERNTGNGDFARAGENAPGAGSLRRTLWIKLSKDLRVVV